MGLVYIIDQWVFKKSASAYVYLFPPLSSEASGLEKMIWLKYYTERQITFNLGLNADKNTNFLKNGSEFNFLQKTQ